MPNRPNAGTLGGLSSVDISTLDPRTADASPRTAEFSDRSRGIAGASPKANVQAIVNCIDSCGERFYWYTFLNATCQCLVLQALSRAPPRVIGGFVNMWVSGILHVCI